MWAKCGIAPDPKVVSGQANPTTPLVGFILSPERHWIASMVHQDVLHSSVGLESIVDHQWMLLVGPTEINAGQPRSIKWPRDRLHSRLSRVFILYCTILAETPRLACIYVVPVHAVPTPPVRGLRHVKSTWIKTRKMRPSFIAMQHILSIVVTLTEIR